MKNRRRGKRGKMVCWRLMLIWLTVGFSLVYVGSSEAEFLGIGNVEVHGYIDQSLSFNLQNQPETTFNDLGKMSMIRTMFKLDTNVDLKEFGRFTGVFRLDEEINNSYLRRLQDVTKVPVNTSTFGGTGAAKKQLIDIYADNDLWRVVRELYWDYKVAPFITTRLGRQLVAWGKTDFFQAMDVIHGFNNTWRSFLAPDEERRKPLWMINVIVDVPKVELSKGFNFPGGNIQVLYAPRKINDGNDIGSDFDIFGGRWATQPFRGINFVDPALLPFNFKAREANPNQADQYGVRWNGRLFSNLVDYSLAYWHGFHKAPIFRANPLAPNAFGGPILPEDPYDRGNVPTKGFFGEIIYPETDLVGGAFSAYISFLDIVVRGEVAYMWNKPYNIGSPPLSLFTAAGGFPGLAGIVLKKTATMSLNFDKNVNFVKYLGASRPGFMTVQLFDEWITNFNRSDDIVDNAGYGARQKGHSLILTAVLNWTYFHTSWLPITASLAGGTDLSYSGFFIIPSIQFNYGNHWVLGFEADIFKGAHPATDVGQIVTGTQGMKSHLMDLLDRSDQFFMTLKYQF